METYLSPQSFGTVKSRSRCQPTVPHSVPTMGATCLRFDSLVILSDVVQYVWLLFEATAQCSLDRARAAYESLVPCEHGQ